ncbi:sulfurtransferase TusA family protein [Marinitoga aeolica]|uniref:Sulfurtransferase TusA family protein n=1 Tax=Marinitoga aeolica TaxID=2809031 RepID=A0ABY8PNW6_9BACT|nr:sulfurtransferase TusA family protein [Marinitoga aeolica]WGS64317.1 sulfurtransferase TusA family protein [Marinitoga aeolica]
MKKNLTLQDLFKALANQIRMEILISIFDNYLTASEIAEKLNHDISTIYRHLLHMKKIGILKSERKNGIEYFDFSSTKIFHIIENAIEFISEIKGNKVIDCTHMGRCLLDQNSLNIEPDMILDMRGEICPVPDIQTRKVLKNMKKEQVLLVIVDYPLSAERIPISIAKEGHILLGKINEIPGETKLYIKRAKKIRRA